MILQNKDIDGGAECGKDKFVTLTCLGPGAGF